MHIFKRSDRLPLRHRHPSLLSKGVGLGGDQRAGVSTGTAVVDFIIVFSYDFEYDRYNQDNLSEYRIFFPRV
ncbi:unnamed protein product [Lactuca virosa]|uniref:Uncharacterized protein n=1 Tax=Lactuca virosa TaxID=75947 RepID=A0AAU9LL30_9ASTR|nr:unnamed protein product [Lactuca virosa]